MRPVYFFFSFGNSPFKIVITKNNLGEDHGNITWIRIQSHNPVILFVFRFTTLALREATSCMNDENLAFWEKSSKNSSFFLNITAVTPPPLNGTIKKKNLFCGVPFLVEFPTITFPFINKAQGLMK